MVQNLKLTPTPMERRYVNANHIIVNARDSITLRMLLWVMIPTEIAMCSDTISIRLIAGVLTTKRNYLPIWWWSQLADTTQCQECMPAKELPSLWDTILKMPALILPMMQLISISWLVMCGIWSHSYHSTAQTKVTLRICLCLAWLKMVFLYAKLDTKCIMTVTAKTEIDSSGDVLSELRRTVISNVIFLIRVLLLAMVEWFTHTQKTTHVYILLLPEEPRNGKTYMTIEHQQREYSSERRMTSNSLISRHVQRSVIFSMLYWQLLLFMLILGIVRITQRIVQSHFNVISSYWHHVFSRQT